MLQNRIVEFEIGCLTMAFVYVSLGETGFKVGINVLPFSSSSICLNCLRRQVIFEEKETFQMRLRISIRGRVRPSVGRSVR